MYYSKSATVPPFVTMPGRNNGGINKGGSKSSKVGKDSKQTITKTKKLRSTEAGTDKVLLLRAALFDAKGTDKNVLDDFKAFQKFNRNGLDLELSFATGKTNQLRKWMHALCKKNMEEDYSKDYGWDDDDKNEELKEPAARFIVVREKPTVAWEQGTPVAFVHCFRSLAAKARSWMPTQGGGAPTTKTTTRMRLRTCGRARLPRGTLQTWGRIGFGGCVLRHSATTIAP